MSKKSILGPSLMIGGGAAVIGAAIFAFKKSNATTDAVKSAVDGSGSPKVNLRLTTYYPFQEGLTAAQRKMEGAPVDRRGAALYTVEDFFAGKSDHVSLSGDTAVWPYGQKLLIPTGDNKVITGRVTDTGGHFRGTGKVYRMVGYEPIDVCTATDKTKMEYKIPNTVTATIIPGDNFEHGKAVATAGIKNQQVVVGMVNLLEQMGLI